MLSRDEINKLIIKRMGIKREVDNLPYGSGKRYDRFTLGKILAELNYNKGAEIGVRRGKYSKYLCQCNPNLELYCIDPWNAYCNKYPQAKQDKIYDDAVNNLKGCNVKIIRKNSIDALSDIQDESLDFVFIDGNHTYDYVAPDIINWSKKIRQNGIIMVHDYYAFGWSGVVQAVNSYTFCHDIRPWFVTKEYEPTAYWVKP